MDGHAKVDSPVELASGSGATRMQYRQKPGYYAIHHWDDDAGTDSPVLRLDDAAIFFGEESSSAGQKSGPVYEAQPDGTPAVPTGRVFVRFEDSVRAESRESAVRKAGYRLVQVPAWAPHTAWVEALTGDVADSLCNLGKLQQLRDVENVEPEMLMPVRTRV
jgi:hypothetical protein